MPDEVTGKPRDVESVTLFAAEPVKAELPASYQNPAEVPVPAVVAMSFRPRNADETKRVGWMLTPLSLKLDTWAPA